MVGAALRRLERELHSEAARTVLGDVTDELTVDHGPQATLTTGRDGGD